MRHALALGLLLLTFGAAACGGSTAQTAPANRTDIVSPGLIRSPAFTKSMDTNPANLASAVITHAFGQLPEYIDDANFRLLPFDMFRVFEPGHSLHHTVRLTTPRTGLVLDTSESSGPTSTEARLNASAYSGRVTIDGKIVPALGRYWLYYRNNGPQICRIYYPGDLSSLNMAVQSLVLRPLPPGQHEISVVVVRRSPGSPPARVTTRYLLTVLNRPPSKTERAIAPADDSPKPPSRTPLTFAATSNRH